MIVSKYHVGDLVRILDPVPEGWVGTNDFMREQAGKTTTVEEVIPAHKTPEKCVYRLKGMRGWNWESIMLEPVEESHTDEDEDIPAGVFGEFFDGFEVLE